MELARRQAEDVALELANKIGAQHTLIVGDNEIAAGAYALKNMTSGEQTSVSREDLLEPLLTELKMPEPEQSCNSTSLATFAARTPAAQLRREDAGKRAILMGWVHRRRDLGDVIFIHLRDREGVTQIVFDEDLNADVHDRAEQLRSEYVVAVEGMVELRTPDTINPNIPTGEVEVARRARLDSERIAHAAVPDGRDRGRQRRRAPEVSLCRSAPAAHAAQHHPALEDRVRRAAVPAMRRASSKSRRRS